MAKLALLAALSWTVLATMDIDRWHSWWLLAGCVLLIAFNSGAVLRTTKRPSGQKTGILMPEPWPPKVRLNKRTKGYELRHDDGYQVATLSAMDAAKLPFQVKDELRRTKFGRDCVDRVADQRRRSQGGQL